MKLKPAGWYRNANDRRQHCYWDGFAWVDPSPIDGQSGVTQEATAEPVDTEDSDARMTPED